MKFTTLFGAAAAASLAIACDAGITASAKDKVSARDDVANAAQSPAGTVSPNRLEADVRFLADDLLEGRDTGQRGYDIAANYVAMRFKALGLAPGGDDGTYFQRVPLIETKSSGFSGTVSFPGADAPDDLKDLKAGPDFYILARPHAEKDEVEAEVVFVGYGLVAEQHGRDDFAGLDVEGKIVMHLVDMPSFLNSEERAHYRATFNKVASDRGAVGVIRVHTPAYEDTVKWEDILDLVRVDTSMNWRDEDGAGYSSSPNLRGVGRLNTKPAKALITAAGGDWDEILKASREEQGEVAGFATGVTARLTYTAAQRTLESANVLGVIPGTDPDLKNEYVVVTAHLDHTGVKPLQPKAKKDDEDRIFNGAMDNATGVASILEVARLLADKPLKRSVMFAAVTAEEKGLVGSDFLARTPPMRDGGAFVANINMDMPIITYPFTDVVAFGAERSTMFPVIEAAAQRADLELVPDPLPEEGFFTRSDQYRFVQQGVPAVYLDLGFGNGGEDAQTDFLDNHYHQLSDEADRIDYDQLGRFAKVNYEIVEGVANMETRPLWKKGDFFASFYNGPMEE